MSEELKLCPFCGGPGGDCDDAYLAPVTCDNDSCIMWPNFYTVEQWNTRPLEDALRAELAVANAEVERHKPIPVSERMPDETEWVLIYDSLAPRWVSGMLVSLSPGRLQWSTIDGYYFHGGNSKEFSRVTHWMPLPDVLEASHE